MNKGNKGITLIALVITIVVLLILAGITINILFDKNGIIRKAEDASGKYQQKAENELTSLENLADKIDDIINEVKDPNPGELSGSGTRGNPYFIQSIEDLVAFSNEVNNGNDYTTQTYQEEYVQLIVSLDFKSDNSYMNPKTKEFGDINENGEIEELKTELTTGAGFLPIGVRENFSGIFNGGNHEIKNIYINRSSDNIGLFGSIRNNAEIKNIIIRGNIQASNANVGGIVGIIGDSCNIENCKNKVNIIASQSKVGGIVGMSTKNYGNHITNCINEGDITLTGNAELYLGGIIGCDFNTNIVDSKNYGNLKIDAMESKLHMGDIIGAKGELSMEPVRCFNEGILTRIENSTNNMNSYLGGIVGYIEMYPL